MHDAGVPAGVFNLVNGQGTEVGAALATHPDVDMISITGSTRAGVLVAQAAAPTVKRVAQELGGKSPNVILPDADFAHAIPAAVAAGMRNVGQSCSAPTRIIVPRERLAEVERARARGGLRVRRRRSAFAADHARPGGQPRAVRPRAGNDRCRHRRRRAPGLRRPRPAAGAGARLLRAPDALLRRAAADAHRAGRDLRPGAGHHRLRQRGRGGGDRQRHRLRPGRARPGPGPRCRACGGRAHPLRAGAHQQPALDAPMRPSAATSGRATDASTASKAWRSTSRPRPSSATAQATMPAARMKAPTQMNTRNTKEQRS